MTTEIAAGHEGREIGVRRDLPPGGAFLVGPTEAAAIFTPELLSEEQRAIGKSVRAFVEQEVTPRRTAIESKDYATHRALMARLGRDGFLGIEVPEAYGGAGLDRATTVVVTAALADAGSFAVTYSAHTGIGTLPIVFFGSDDQRRRYLPGLASGELIGAYALTEPSAGSDAQAIRTRATREPDGSFVLDGSKQFITNAGFADLFTVYAKVEGEAMTGFLVERTTPGLTIGPEEHKLGIHGASTCPLTFDGVRVPASAVLGEIGKGHRIAFNVLNVGRLKLAAACLGGMRSALRTGFEYAAGRVAFGRPIVRFPLIAAKLAGMAARTYATESAIYRVAGLIDQRLATVERADGAVTAPASAEEIRRALEEVAVECSIAKVLGSEELGAVVDELVSIHGGYGYIEDYPAAAAYRDARINRIWEGTNEINRLLVPGTLVKRALQGRLDLLGPARRAQDALLEGGRDEPGEGPLGAEEALVTGLRQVTLLLSGAAVQRFGADLEEQQEVLAGLADLAIALFATESSVLRAAAALATGNAASDAHVALARMVVADRVGQSEILARSLAASVAEGDDARMLQAGVRRLLRSEPVDRVGLGRQVARAVVAARGQPV